MSKFCAAKLLNPKLKKSWPVFIKIEKKERKKKKMS